MGISPNSSLGAAVCRICHCGETSIPYGGASGGSAGEPLISPCHCKGTMGLYHRSCVEHWLSLSGTACCEICDFRFELQRRYRTFFEFIRMRGCFIEEGRGTMTDVMCFTVLTPFALGSTYLCLNAGWNCYDSENDWDAGVRRRKTIEGIAMFAMAAFLVMIYSLWLGVTVAFYRSEYRSWRKKNMVINVVDQLSPDESIHFNGRRPSIPGRIWRKVKSSTTTITRAFTRVRDRISILSPRSSPGVILPAMMRQETRVLGSRGQFLVTPMDSFYAAGHNIEYPANVYSESAAPLLGVDESREDSTMMEMLTRRERNTSISPIPVCAPCAPPTVSATIKPPVPERQPTPPSLMSSFTCTPPEVTMTGTLGRSSRYARRPGTPSPEEARLIQMRRRSTPISVTASSGSLLQLQLVQPQMLQQSQLQAESAARTPLSATLSTISSISPQGFAHHYPQPAQKTPDHLSTVRARPLLTSTPSSSRAVSVAYSACAAAAAATPDRMETQV